jgi:hypothetical protein
MKRIICSIFLFLFIFNISIGERYFFFFFYLFLFFSQVLESLGIIFYANHYEKSSVCLSQLQQFFFLHQHIFFLRTKYFIQKEEFFIFLLSNSVISFLTHSFLSPNLNIHIFFLHFTVPPMK